MVSASGTEAHGRLEAFERGRVSEVQRARVLAAMTHVVAERGVGNVSVGDVVARAGVSRRTFYELFRDGQECLLAAIDRAIVYTGERLLAAYDPGAPWRVRIRAGLAALLALFDEEPAIAHLLVVQSLAGGPAALERRQRTIAHLVAAVDEGRAESRNPESVLPLAGEGVVGAVLALLHSRIGQSRERPISFEGEGRLSDMLNELMSVIVLPFLGGAAARRELERPLPGHPSEDRAPAMQALSADPFKEAGMRLTYRTVRVLWAVGENPGASNRRIGIEAEVSDQGQISKLLSRLRRLGLVENVRAEPQGRGDPNAWRLTRAGARVMRTIASQSTGTHSQGGTR